LVASRVDLGTAVLLPALRNPVVLAQQVATLDQISEGRVILGVGIASDFPNIRSEFVAAGVPFEKRVGRLLEGMQLCRALWTGKPAPVDVMLVGQLLSGALGVLQHGSEFDPTSTLTMLGFCALFLVVDLAAGVFAVALEPGENWRMALWLPVQRFGYRQFMYFVVCKAIAKALSGAPVGWGRLDRKGTVRILTVVSPAQ